MRLAATYFLKRYCFRLTMLRIVLPLYAAAGLISPANAATLQLEPLITSIEEPVSIVHAGDQSGRLFIVQRIGKIAIYNGRQILPAPFLDVSSFISSGSEQGLLDAAFHPDYATNGFVYISYTNLIGDSVIARYSVSTDPDRADPGSSLVVLTLSQPATNHNGGQIQFGPEGYLHIGLGDGGGSGDPQDNAQNLNTLLGKILRIDVDNGSPYAVPPDNPFVNSPDARPEIWAFGLRNPWRFSFDRLDGNLFIADVGQDKSEELNFEPGHGNGGANYGWRLMEGSQCFDPPQNCLTGDLILPILEYDHSLGCSITGGYVYRGTNNPDFIGTYIYGDFCSGRIWGADQDTEDRWSASLLLESELRITSFGENEDGELYVASLTPAPGAVYRISQTTEDASPSDTGGVSVNCMVNTIAAQLFKDHHRQ